MQNCLQNPQTRYKNKVRHAVQYCVVANWFALSPGRASSGATPEKEKEEKEEEEES